VTLNINMVLVTYETEGEDKDSKDTHVTCRPRSM
jgi:hypothetical protein